MTVETHCKELERRYGPPIMLSNELKRLTDAIGEAKLEMTQIHSALESFKIEHEILEESSVLMSFGFYKPVYNFAASDEYQRELEDVRFEQKELLKSKIAATCRIEWQVNGSKTEGRKQTNQTLKLMLRAFNGECDAAIAKVNYKNVKAMQARIEKSAEAIEALVTVQQCFIERSYVRLKIKELQLVFEYEEKLQAERDEQKRIREQMRDEETARREIERARVENEREQSRAVEALRKAKEEVLGAEGAKHDRLAAKIAELEQRLALTEEKGRAISQAQITKAGHVYVISNVGSFGENVYKIGMTRRLVPQDRIDELGDASVPFEFDVHAIISTSDAPTLENKIHRSFKERRLNRINERKEFFHVSLEEIATVVRAEHGEFELIRVAEAADYRKTLALIDQEHRNGESVAQMRLTPPQRPERRGNVTGAPSIHNAPSQAEWPASNQSNVDD